MSFQQDIYFFLQRGQARDGPLQLGRRGASRNCFHEGSKPPPQATPVASYALLKAASEISFGQVLRIIDGPLAPLPCVSGLAYRRCTDCEDEANCALRRVFAVSHRATVAVLEVTEPDKRERDHRLNRLLADFAVGHLRKVPATALSGGERRRVEIARCLAAKPNYVLLDEPLAGIDPIAVADIRDLVSHLKDRGIGVLITDHNVRDTLDIVDRAYVLNEGGVLAEGTPAQIVNDPAVRRVYLGERFSL